VWAFVCAGGLRGNVGACTHIAYVHAYEDGCVHAYEDGCVHAYEKGYVHAYCIQDGEDS